MSIVSLVLGLVVLGVGLYLVETYLPIAAPIKVLIRLVVVAVAILWVLSAFGVLGPRPLGPPVPRA